MKLFAISIVFLSFFARASDWSVGIAIPYGGAIHYKIKEDFAIGPSYVSTLSDYGFSNYWGVSGAWKPFSNISERGFVMDFYFQGGVKAVNEVVFNNYSSRVFGVSFGYQIIAPEVTGGLFGRFGIQFFNEDLVRLDTGLTSRRNLLWPFVMIGYYF